MKITKELSDRALAPLIRFAQATPGTVALLTDRLTKLTGETQYRQNISEWLHPDPKRRIEPRLGMGLLLIKVFKDFGNGHRKAAKPARRNQVASSRLRR